jgi:hypothetical protein
VATTTGQGAATPVYYDAVLRLEPGTWMVEGISEKYGNGSLDDGEATGCVDLLVQGGATMENHFYPGVSELQQRALVTVPDDPDGIAEVVFRCRRSASGDFTVQLFAAPATIQVQP